MTTAGVALPCPYVGLDPFQEADHEFFFGRDRERQVVAVNLLSSSLTILYGASGVGKSSLLMAGVMPYLREAHQGTPVVVFRDWADEHFEAALARACIAAVWRDERAQSRPAEDLPFDELLRSCAEAAHDRVLVLFDQFEEYFLYHPKAPGPDSFEAGLARAVNRDDVDVGILFSLREDSLSKLDRFRERIPNLFGNRLILKHLDEDGAVAAIRQPLGVWNRKYVGDGPPVGIEDDLVAELIEQVRIGQITTDEARGGTGPTGEERVVEAPFLQLVLTRLWDEEFGSGSRMLRLGTLKRLGGAKAIVRAHLYDVMEGLDAQSRDICAHFFDRLVTPSRGKVACRQDDLVSWATEDTATPEVAAQVGAVLESLCGSRILRTVAQSADRVGVTGYEVYHDVLAPAVLEWRAGYCAARKQADLRRQVQLKERNNRRLWGALGVSLVAGVLALTAMGYALNRERQAMMNAAISGSYSKRDQTELRTLLALHGLSLARAGDSADDLARAADAVRRALQQPLKWSRTQGGQVKAVAYHPDGRLVATASGRQVRLWDAATGKEAIDEPMQCDAEVEALAFTVDGKWLITGDHEGHLLRWDAVAGTPAPTPSSMRHGGEISAMAAGPGDRLATGSLKDGLVILWNLADGTRTGVLRPRDGKPRWVADLAFNAAGDRLAVADVNITGETEVWDLSGATARFAFALENWRTGPDGGPDPRRKMLVDAVAFSPDGRWLATGDRDSRVNLWDAKTGRYLDTLWGHTDQVTRLAFSKDGRRLASAGGDSTARVWETQTGRLLLTLTGHTKWINDLAFSPDGDRLITGSKDRQAKLWQVAMHAGAVDAVAFAPRDGLLATGGIDGTVKVWELGSRTLLATLPDVDRVTELAFSPDGRALATASLDHRVRVWRWEGGAGPDDADQPALVLDYADPKSPDDKFYDLAYSRTGQWLAAAGANHNAVVWDAATGERKFAGHHEGQVWGVAFSPVEDLLASAGYGQVKLWRVPSWEPAGCFQIPYKWANDVNFSPDGRHLVIATGTEEVFVADLPPDGVRVAGPDGHTGGQCPEAAVLKGPTGMHGPVSFVQFTPDGKKIVLFGLSPSVDFVGIDDGWQTKSVSVHREKVNDVAFSPDGFWFATASEDGTFQASPLDDDELRRLGCARVTSTLTAAECRENLGADHCPSDPCADLASPAR